MKILRNRQHCHQSAHPNVGVSAHFFVGGHPFVQGKTAFGKFAAYVDLQQTVRRPARALGALLQFVGKLQPVQGMDEVRFSDQVFYLVGLQMSDEVPVCAVHEVVLVAELLHFVFADVGDACGDGFVDLFGGARLGRGDEGDLLAEGVSARNLFQNVLYVFRDHVTPSCGNNIIVLFAVFVNVSAKALAPSFSGMTTEELQIAVEQYLAIDAWCSNPVMSEESYTKMMEIINSTSDTQYTANYSKIVDNTIANTIAK